VVAVLLAGFGIAECTSTPSPIPAGSVPEYCAAAFAYAKACAIDDPCTTATNAQCAAVAAHYSAAALGILTSCTEGVACGEAGAATGAFCAEYWLAVMPPSDAQATLARDYCGACAAAAQTAAACESDFYASVDDAGGLDVVTGTGYPLLPWDDSITTAAGKSCLPKLPDGGSLGCATFTACAMSTIAASIPRPPPACGGGNEAAPSGEAD
jgi:hypothetical protein